ncbi:hypothetical protein FRB99_004031 [Tulasnella sp. 403]|nr:hypothetical protein FRB99_004031 [Tulasnella sp. 403]
MEKDELDEEIYQMASSSTVNGQPVDRHHTSHPILSRSMEATETISGREKPVPQPGHDPAPVVNTGNSMSCEAQARVGVLGAHAIATTRPSPIPSTASPRIPSGVPPPAPNESHMKAKIQRIFQACNHCKKRKSRCDGAQPACGNCRKACVPCEFSGERRMRGPNKNKKPHLIESRTSHRNFGNTPSPTENDSGHARTSPLQKGEMGLVHPPMVLDPLTVDNPAHGSFFLTQEKRSGSSARSTTAKTGHGMVSSLLPHTNEPVELGNLLDTPDRDPNSSQNRPGAQGGGTNTVSHSDERLASSASTSSQPPDPILPPSHRVTEISYTLPRSILVNISSYPSPATFEEVVETYLNSLSRKAADKALVTQKTYDAILAVLRDSEASDLPNGRDDGDPELELGHLSASAAPDDGGGTPLFKFWVRKSFTLGKVPKEARAEVGFGKGGNGNDRSASTPPSASGDQAHADEDDAVLHNGRPIAVREQLYHILLYCHAATKHGGRDKTCALINNHYSWIPKAFVEEFVKSCPGCPRKRVWTEPQVALPSVSRPHEPSKIFKSRSVPKSRHQQHSAAPTFRPQLPSISTLLDAGAAVSANPNRGGDRKGKRKAVLDEGEDNLGHAAAKALHAEHAVAAVACPGSTITSPPVGVIGTSASVTERYELDPDSARSSAKWKVRKVDPGGTSSPLGDE